jgi:hypothetical protein
MTKCRIRLRRVLMSHDSNESREGALIFYSRFSFHSIHVLSTARAASDHCLAATAFIAILHHLPRRRRLPRHRFTGTASLVTASLKPPLSPPPSFTATSIVTYFSSPSAASASTHPNHRRHDLPARTADGPHAAVQVKLHEDSLRAYRYVDHASYGDGR